MTSPHFSILIPTRDRVETFIHTLATVVAQPGDDFEIVVADNASRPGIREAVDAVTSVPVRYLRSETILNIDANWERGLDACRGDYVTVLGDDDAFVPTTLEAVRRIQQSARADLLSWAVHTYWWPDTFVTWNRNQLYVGCGDQVLSNSSRETLVRFMDGSIPFGSLPMLYNSFVHRSLLARIKEKHGTYFPIPHLPDVVSGVLLLSLTDRFVYSDWPLAVRGNSGQSQGTSYWCRSLGAERREATQKEEGITLDKLIHPALIPSPNLQILLASCRMWCRDLLFPGVEEFRIDPLSVVGKVLATLNDEPEAYDENLADAKALAAKLGLSIKPAAIPARRPLLRRPQFGLLKDQNGRIAAIGVNGALAGLRNVRDAAWLADALMPGMDMFIPT
jgi:hypothetical protein